MLTREEEARHDAPSSGGFPKAVWIWNSEEVTRTDSRHVKSKGPTQIKSFALHMTELGVAAELTRFQVIPHLLVNLPRLAL